VKRRMIPALHDHESVARKILARHEPRGRGAVLQTADAKAAALSERVAGKAQVPADDLTVRRFDRTRNCGQPGLQEIPEWALADEADAGGVALVEYRQSALAGDCTNLALAQRAQREVAAGKLRGTQHVQEITLVLCRIDAAQQSPPAGDSRVVTGRESLSAQAPCIREAETELDLAVAQHIGIRGPACAQFRQEVREHALAIFRRKTDAMQRDAKLRAAAARILEVRGSRAIAFAVILPVRHEQALDIVAGIQQQRCRHRGIDAAGHCDDVSGHPLQPMAAGGEAGSM